MLDFDPSVLMPDFSAFEEKTKSYPTDIMQILKKYDKSSQLKSIDEDPLGKKGKKGKKSVIGKIAHEAFTWLALCAINPKVTGLKIDHLAGFRVVVNLNNEIWLGPEDLANWNLICHAQLATLANDSKTFPEDYDIRSGKNALAAGRVFLNESWEICEVDNNSMTFEPKPENSLRPLAIIWAVSPEKFAKKIRFTVIDSLGEHKFTFTPKQLGELVNEKFTQAEQAEFKLKNNTALFAYLQRQKNKPESAKLEITKERRQQALTLIAHNISQSLYSPARVRKTEHQVTGKQESPNKENQRPLSFCEGLSSPCTPKKKRPVPATSQSSSKQARFSIVSI